MSAEIKLSPETLNQYPIVGHLGNPENTFNNTQIPRLVVTTEALQKLSDILATVKSPGQDEGGGAREFGFFGIGLDVDDPTVRGKKVLVVSEWILSPVGENSDGTEKKFTSDFLADAIHQADLKKITVVARGHDHHEVATNTPSGVDNRTLIKNGPNINFAEIIVRRSRFPNPIAAWTPDSLRDKYLHIGGIEVINTNNMPPEDVKTLIEYFAYVDEQNQAIQYIDGMAITTPFEETCTLKPDFPKDQYIEVTLPETDNNVIAKKPEQIVNISSEELDQQTPSEPFIEIVNIQSLDDQISTKKMGLVEKAWKKFTGQL